MKNRTDICTLEIEMVIQILNELGFRDIDIKEDWYKFAGHAVSPTGQAIYVVSNDQRAWGTAPKMHLLLVEQPGDYDYHLKRTCFISPGKLEELARELGIVQEREGEVESKPAPVDNQQGTLPSPAPEVTDDVDQLGEDGQFNLF